MASVTAFDERSNGATARILFERGHAALKRSAGRDTVRFRVCELRGNGDMHQSSTEDHSQTGRIPEYGEASYREPVAGLAWYARALASQGFRPRSQRIRCRLLFALHKTISSVSL